MSDLELEPLDDEPQPTDADGQDAKTYRGPERRSGIERRKGGDRRDQVRFDPDAGDRRSGTDRRRGGWKGGDDRW
jgi:hypothetical protein